MDNHQQLDSTVAHCSSRYFTWHTALLGSLMNLVILFLVSWIFGLISLAAMIAIIMLLQFTGKSKDWGDVSQALVYHQVRKWLLLLDDADRGHTKYVVSTYPVPVYTVTLNL